MDAGDRVPLHLLSPLRIDRLRQVETPQIERQVRHVDEVVHHDEACREEQAVGRALAIDAVEIAQLGDHPAGRIDDDDLVRLVRGDPQVVRCVDDEMARFIEPSDEWPGLRV